MLQEDRYALRYTAKNGGSPLALFSQKTEGVCRVVGINSLEIWGKEHFHSNIQNFILIE